MEKDLSKKIINQTSQRYYWIFGFVVIGFLGLVFFELQNPPISGDSKNSPLIETRKFYVLEVIDGDTIVIKGDNFVRLIGIDAPEKDRPCFEESKKVLEDLILNKYVILSKDISYKDGYGRLLRYVFINGENINLKIVQNGFAKAMPITPDLKYDREIKAAEEKAKVEKRGCLNN